MAAVAAQVFTEVVRLLRREAGSELCGCCGCPGSRWGSEPSGWFAAGLPSEALGPPRAPDVSLRRFGLQNHAETPGPLHRDV